MGIPTYIRVAFLSHVIIPQLLQIKYQNVKPR